ncbi:Ig-like domain-containing protein [Streptococcus pacificus]|uniref:Ig-like domain-containing protein n=1 Tax=Streptococcus pacificus TaxID=2740577 RepID=A0ABS0ZJF2_9STRE|nr:Ig-like domain-containing protein [Streptococcus pacificus]MBJ8326130.1 Ig-like domain-containing protein [Streptococcus pacificus]
MNLFNQLKSNISYIFCSHKLSIKGLLTVLVVCGFLFNSSLFGSPTIVYATTTFKEFSLEETTLSIGKSTTLHITFEEPVFYLRKDSFNTKGVRITDLYSTDDAKTWTAIIVPLSNYNGLGKITLMSGAYYNALDGTQGSGNVIEVFVDTIAPLSPTINYEDPGADGVYNIPEVGPDGTITARVIVPTDTEVGDILIINGASYTITQDIIANGQEVEVAPDTTLSAYIIDKAGNKGQVAADRAAPEDASRPDASTTQLMINDVTMDNIITSQEGQTDIVITGQASGVFTAGDTIYLRINGVDYQGQVDDKGNFSITVKGSDLVADSDKTIDASLTATNTVGNQGTIVATKTYTLAPVPEAPTLTHEDPGSDGVYSQDEVGSDGTVAVTVKVPSGTAVGDILTIDGKDYEVTQAILTNGQLLEVKPGASVEAFITNTFGEVGPMATIMVSGQFKIPSKAPSYDLPVSDFVPETKVPDKAPSYDLPVSDFVPETKVPDTAPSYDLPVSDFVAETRVPDTAPSYNLPVSDFVPETRVPDTAPSYDLPVSDFVPETKVPDTAPSYDLPVSDFVAETRVPDTAPSYDLPVSDFVPETKIPDTAPSNDLPKVPINNEVSKNSQSGTSKSTSKGLPKTGDNRQFITIIGSFLVAWSILFNLFLKRKNN